MAQPPFRSISCFAQPDALPFTQPIEVTKPDQYWLVSQKAMNPPQQVWFPGRDAGTDDATVKDVHCLVLHMQLGRSGDPKLQIGAYSGVLYFMGKLDGHAPNLDLESSILAEFPKLNTETLQAEGLRCGKELQVRGAYLVKMGKDLQQRAVEMQQQENSR